MSDNIATGSGASSGRAKQGSTGKPDGKPAAELKDLGGQVATAFRTGATSLFEEQRNRAADEIASLGEALQRSTQSLDGSIGQAILPYAEDAARQVGDFADTLRGRSLAQLGSDLEGFARSWPMAFLAAAIGTGFIAGRFLLSSSQSTGSETTQYNTSGVRDVDTPVPSPKPAGTNPMRPAAPQPTAASPAGSAKAEPAAAAKPGPVTTAKAEPAASTATGAGAKPKAGDR
jgi:hypothetical protein